MPRTGRKRHGFPDLAERKRRLHEVWTREAAQVLTLDDKRRRLGEVKRYCAEQWPVAFPVTLRIERGAKQSDGLYLGGLAWQLRKRFYLRVNPEPKKMALLIDTLVHEWAHLRTTKHEAVERLDLTYSHGSEWGLAYAEIYSDFFDHDDDRRYLGGAWEASRGY